MLWLFAHRPSRYEKRMGQNFITTACTALTTFAMRE
jgi:hypothetical protein